MRIRPARGENGYIEDHEAAAKNPLTAARGEGRGRDTEDRCQVSALPLAWLTYIYLNLLKIYDGALSQVLNHEPVSLIREETWV